MGFCNPKAMISLKHARRSDRLMKATTSLTVAEFDELAQELAKRCEQNLSTQTVEGATRQHQPGGGRKGALATPPLKLFFILFYDKACPTQDVMGLLFGLTQGQVSHWVGRLTTLAAALMPLHKPARKARALRDILEAQPEIKEVIPRRHRATTAPAPARRPATPPRQRAQETARGEKHHPDRQRQSALVLTHRARSRPRQNRDGKRAAETAQGNHRVGRQRILPDWIREKRHSSRRGKSPGAADCTGSGVSSTGCWRGNGCRWSTRWPA